MFGFDILLKLAYPIPSTSGIAVAPYFAVGPQYMIHRLERRRKRI